MVKNKIATRFWDRFLIFWGGLSKLNWKTRQDFKGPKDEEPLFFNEATTYGAKA